TNGRSPSPGSRSGTWRSRRKRSHFLVRKSDRRWRLPSIRRRSARRSGARQSPPSRSRRPGRGRDAKALPSSAGRAPRGPGRPPEGGWPKGYSPTLLAPSELPGFDVSALADALKTSLQTADIPVRVRLEPDAALRTARGSGEHDIALAEATIAGGDPHLFLYPLSTREGASVGPTPPTFSFYSNPLLGAM